MDPATVTDRWTWFYFVSWMLVGACFTMVVLGALTIGIFFIPFAVVGTLLLSRRPRSRRGLPGLFGGLGLPLFYVAYLNRGGPGMVCASTHNAYGSGQSCTQEWSPWPWFGAGLAFIAVAMVVLFISLRTDKRGRCPICATALGRTDRYCTSCGSRVGEIDDRQA